MKATLFLKRLLFIYALIFSFNINHAFGQTVSYSPIFTDATFSRQIDLSLPVGIIEGGHSVSSTGAVTYNIPIKVAPGTSGMEPTISINYNSQAGSSICGLGWNISGFSAITRSGRNYWNDEWVSPPLINNNDAFAIDGSRLTAWTGNNGANNTIYGTEAESYARITSYGNIGNGPQYFTAWMKNGGIYEYGNSVDSRVMTNSGNDIMAWKVNKIIDANGNYISFKYTLSGGEHRIDEVWYTGNTALGIAPYNYLKFDYQLRQDKNTVYETGNAFASLYVLSSIKAYSEGNQLVHNYTFSYGTDKLNLYSFLQTVTECGTGNSCFNDTRFKYGNEAVVSKDMDARNASGLLDIVNGQSGSQDIITGDFNGDGFSDVMQFWKHVDNNITYTDSFKVKLKDPSGNGFTTSYVYNLPGDYQVINSLNIPNSYNFHVSDFDGDGTDDIMLAFRKKYSNRTELDKILIYTKLNQQSPAINTYYPPSSFRSVGYERNCVYPGDFDGDGRVDFITLGSNNGTFHCFFTSPSKGYINEPIAFARSYNGSTYNSYLTELAGATTASAVDFDGDGKHDLFFTPHVLNQPYGYSIVVGFEWDNSNSTWTAKNLYEAGYPTHWHTVLFGDFNGDRKTDLLTRTNDDKKWEMALSDGKQFQAQAFNFDSNPAVYQNSPSYAPSPWDDDLLMLNDFNGDGKTDILHGKNYWSSSTSLSCNYTMYYSRGNRDVQKFKFSTAEQHGVWYFSGDFSGDGKSDYLSYSGGNSEYKMTTFWDQAPDRLLSKVSNGFNNTVSFTHRTLTDPFIGNYNWSGPASYPYNNIISPIWCVSKVVTPNGIGGNRDITYLYSDARFHKGGKGFLGFTTFTSRDWTSGTDAQQSVTFDQSLFVPLQTVSKTSVNGIDISRNTVNYQITSLGNKRYKQEVPNTYSEDLLAGT